MAACRSPLCRALAAATLTALLAACGPGEPGATTDTTLRAAPSVLKATLADFNGHGIWWNPAEGGSGFVFEAQGNIGIVAVFTYETNGRPVWYSGSGSFALRTDGKYVFDGRIYRYSGGQRVNSTVVTTPRSTEIGAMTVVFDGESAQVQVPGRSYPARRFYGGTGVAGVQSPLAPETGIYWNPSESGRGYVIETTNTVTWLAAYHYDTDGEPTWNLIVGDIATGSFTADFTSYFGGQTLSGPYKPATLVPATSTFDVSFTTSPCTGQVKFPGMPPVTIRRFAAGTLPAGAECRTGANKVSTDPGTGIGS